MHHERNLLSNLPPRWLDDVLQVNVEHEGLVDHAAVLLRCRQ